MSRLTALSNNIRILAALPLFLLTACSHVAADKAAQGPEIDSSKMAILKKPVGAQSLLSKSQLLYIDSLYEAKADSAAIRSALIRFAVINDSLHAHYTNVDDTVSDWRNFIEEKATLGYSYLTPEVYMGKGYDSITHTYGPTYAREYVGRHFLSSRKVGVELRIPFTYTMIRKKWKEGDSVDQAVIHMPKQGGTLSLLNAGTQPGTVQSPEFFNDVEVQKDLCWVSFSAHCSEKRKVLAQPGKDGTIFADGDWVPAPGTPLNEENRKRLTLNSYNSFYVDGYLRIKMAPGSSGPFTATNRPQLEYIDGWDFFGGGPR